MKEVKEKKDVDQQQGVKKETSIHCFYDKESPNFQGAPIFRFHVCFWGVYMELWGPCKWTHKWVTAVY